MAEQEYVALRDGVVFRLELGFAYVDDGATTYRIDQRVFASLVNQPRRVADLDEQTRGLVEQYPSIFALVPSEEAAREANSAREL